MVPPGLRILLTRSQIIWQCDRLATTTPIGVRRVNKIASVPPYLLRSAFGHDGLWVFANRIFANWIFSNRILAHRRRHWRGWLLARQVGGASSAQHGQQSNSDAQHGDEPGRAQHSKERSRHHSYELHHANPPCLSKPSDERPRDAPIRPQR